MKNLNLLFSKILCLCFLTNQKSKFGQKNQNCQFKLKFGTFNHFHNILRLFDGLPNFLSPQVKRCTIITYKHGVYEFPHELPNDLRLRILRN